MGDEPLAEIDRTISALQDPTRRRILLDFYVHQAEWTTAEVAEAVGVHRTVAHAHLERLVALGYLVSGQRRGTSGKPAKLYRLTGQQIELSYPVRRFARLAAELAQALRGVSEGIDAAREAGRGMARRWSPSPRTPPNPRFTNSLRWLRNTCSRTARSSRGTASSVRRVSRPRTSSASSTPASSRRLPGGRVGPENGSVPRLRGEGLLISGLDRTRFDLIKRLPSL